MSSPEDILNMLRLECERLDALTGTAATKELSVNEIVETYYQVINVSSIVTMLKQATDDTGILPEKISEIERKISEFNSTIHPKILTNLTASIAEATQDLQNQSPQTHTQKEMELNSSAYEDLRQKMSTREFIEQYDKERK